jgi:uncharacterized LabA/DUF88 family protein
MSKRVSVYIDGFNLYHAIDDHPKCDHYHKWLDLYSLSEGLLRNGETLVGVNYYSAYATWLPAQYARHRQYVAALASHGVNAVMGKFKKKNCACKACRATWLGHEEKESDVRLSISLVADAFSDVFDRAIVISADSDLAPPIEMVRDRFKQKEVFVVSPPGRMHYRDLNPRLEITKGRLERALLPESRCDATGNKLFTRPKEYGPPIEEAAAVSVSVTTVTVKATVSK